MRNRPSVKYLGLNAPRPYRVDLPKGERETQIVYLTDSERDDLVEALSNPGREIEGPQRPVPGELEIDEMYSMPQRIAQGVVSDR